MNRSANLADRRAGWLLLLIGTVLVLLFKLIGEQHYGGYFFDLGSPGVPAPRYTVFLAMWGFFGLFAAASLTLGLVMLGVGRRDGEPAAGQRRVGSDWRWIGASVLLAFLIALAVRVFVLHGAPLTDDESAYRFSAQLLADGRLVGESHPDKIFFDRSFMINDGRFYSQYFLGWPALMVPFLWLGISGLANVFLAALTAPAVFLVGRRLGGAMAARLATLFYLSSPFLMVSAATELSHTSCLAALAWLTWAVLRSRDETSGWGPSFLVGLLFCVAFFIRPLTALGIGSPFLLYWIFGLPRRVAAARWRAVLAFAVPCVLLGALFLTINLLQNGSPTKIAYSAALDYARDNGFRFTHWTERTTLSVPLDPGRIRVGAANAGIALFRLNGAMFGWPLSFLLVPLAWRGRDTGVLWASMVAFMLFHLTLLNVGIDSFGPAHYLEVTWPVLLLSAVGVARVTAELEFRRTSNGVEWHRAPVVLAIVLVALALTCYIPPRFRALRSMTEVTNRALRTPEAFGLENAIVFAPRDLPANCDAPSARGFVFWRPNPDPDFSDSVIWANHITAAEDRRLMQYFPGRRGYVFGWQKGCKGAVVPLDSPAADAIPPGRI